MLLLVSIIMYYYMNTFITVHQCTFNLLFALFSTTQASTCCCAAGRTDDVFEFEMSSVSTRSIIIKNWGTHPAILGGRTMASSGDRRPWPSVRQKRPICIQGHTRNSFRGRGKHYFRSFCVLPPFFRSPSFVLSFPRFEVTLKIQLRLKTHLCVFRAQGTCLVAENVVLFLLNEM